MKEFLSNKYLIGALRLVLGFVFILAAAEKISDPDGFALSVSNYRLFPEVTVNLIAVLIPWLEIFSGIMLIMGLYVRENAAIISGLLILFIGLVLISLLRGLNIDCGCFGTSHSGVTGIRKITENLLLLGISFLLISFSDKKALAK